MTPTSSNDSRGGSQRGAAPAPVDPDAQGRAAEVVRHEEELRVGTVPVEAGVVRVRKRVRSEPVTEVIELGVEHAELERVPAEPDDTGEVETLPDGSISVPVLEEELVVTRRTVVRERVIVRKRLEVEARELSDVLRIEEVEVDVVEHDE
jgi:uncharacterized protein (TIGR02271 family)